MRVIGYHGSSKKFNKFDMSFFNKGHGDNGMWGKGFYFTESIDLAELWNDKGYVYKCELNFKKPLILKTEEDREKVMEKYGKPGQNTIDSGALVKQGYDGIISKDETWTDPRGENPDEQHDQYIVFDDRIIKILSVEEYDNSVNEDFSPSNYLINYFNL